MRSHVPDLELVTTAEQKAFLRLPPQVRDLSIDYTALSLVVPEKVYFRYRLGRQHPAWREVVSVRQEQYSNLRPGPYRSWRRWRQTQAIPQEDGNACAVR